MASGSFRKLILVYSFWFLSLMLSASLFEVYFYNLGMPLQDIYLVNCFWFLISLIAIPLMKGFRARDFMLIGIGFAICAASILILFPVVESAYAFRFIISGIYFFFWVPFNTLYYEHRKGNNATMGALYFSVSPLISLVAPATAGFIATSMGFPALFSLAIASFILTAILVYLFVENKTYSYDIASSIKAMAGLKSLTFVEGFAMTVLLWTTLPITLLTFIDRPLGYGIMMSLLTIFTVLASLFMGRLSDRFKKRREFILPTVLLLALSAIFASQATDLTLFFIGFALINFFSGVFFPLPFALLLDNTSSLVDMMIGREMILNIGRICGTLFGLMIFIFTDIQTVILVQGILILLYIPVFENRKKKLRIY